MLRPSSPQTPLIHSLLRWVRGRGFDGVPEPVGVDPDGRERLTYIAGDVPIPPYPSWSATDDALASIARLLRRYHEAASGFPTDGTWNDELADPEGGPLLCHVDVCLENVVFRDGEAVALLDFEYVSPGRATYDLAAMARMCVPVRGDGDAAEVARRLRLAADAYGLDRDGRVEYLAALADQVAHGGEFVARRVARGEQAFIDMWEAGGGMAHFDRRRSWWSANEPLLTRVVAT